MLYIDERINNQCYIDAVKNDFESALYTLHQIYGLFQYSDEKDIVDKDQLKCFRKVRRMLRSIKEID